MYDLDRFKKAQENTFEIALKEIKEGNKKSHWMWFIFPQLKGLGNSALASYYGIENLDEAKAYMKDSKLRNNLIKITKVLLDNTSSDIKSIMGYPDDLKLKSCMTLFFYTGVETGLFKNVIDKFYNGVFDIKTVSLLEKFNEVYIRNTNFDDLDNVLIK
ncbi:MAG: DUF1810 domain-containing protein [Alphaproteobacteria bacterium]|nr:DUF1810 domain-containing protein [Alphaproteobacteria bacterium]